MARRVTDKERLERYKVLNLTEEEAQDLLAYDKAVDDSDGESLEYDLTPERKKVERQMARTGTRKTSPGYKFPKKERKPNATKEGIIAELAEFLEKSSQFETENVEIKTKGKEILLKICGEWYSVTLTYRRNMNKK